MHNIMQLQTDYRMDGWLGFNRILSMQVAAISCLKKFSLLDTKEIMRLGWMLWKRSLRLEPDYTHNYKRQNDTAITDILINTEKSTHNLLLQYFTDATYSVLILHSTRINRTSLEWATKWMVMMRTLEWTKRRSV